MQRQDFEGPGGSGPGVCSACVNRWHDREYKEAPDWLVLLSVPFSNRLSIVNSTTGLVDSRVHTATLLPYLSNIDTNKLALKNTGTLPHPCTRTLSSQAQISYKEPGGKGDITFS